MQLFQGKGVDFIELAFGNYLHDILIKMYREVFGMNPTESEANAWKYSLKAVANSMHSRRLTDTGVVVEYRLPYSDRRIDVIIMGEDGKKENAVIVELKQWEKAYNIGIKEMVQLFPTEIHLHPSAQARGYADYLRDNVTAFYEEPNQISLYSCSYLHNAKSNSCGDLLDEFYIDVLKESPLFTGDMKDEFEDYIESKVYKGNGEKVLRKFISSKVRPSPKLLEHAAEMIQGNPVFTLIDEQKEAFNIVYSKVKQSNISGKKTVVIVTGGPGTGKSVIAVQLLASLGKEGYNVVHCTGSTAFTTTLRAQVGRRASSLFKYFNSFSGLKENTFDVLIADEAHRIRESSNSYYTPKDRKSTKPQIEELIDIAKVGVFLLDRNQNVRPNEIGTPELIERFAKEKNAEIFKIDLRIQFRCSGSSAYIDWLDYVLKIGGQPNLSWRLNNEYEFRIVDSPEELEAMIKEKARQGNTARIVAGFCWKWSDPKPDGTLVHDVSIGSWSKPWNRKREGSYTPQNDPYYIWATQKEGLEQVGCIYSAQGFEFDYCGVIFGNDIVWDEKANNWVGKKENSFDSVVKREKNNFERLIINAYKVLLSRGIKGTYVYFLDHATRKHFEDMLKG